jgi:hypothetical protein
VQMFVWDILDVDAVHHDPDPDPREGFAVSFHFSRFALKPCCYTKRCCRNSQARLLPLVSEGVGLCSETRGGARSAKRLLDDELISPRDPHRDDSGGSVLHKRVALCGEHSDETALREDTGQGDAAGDAGLEGESQPPPAVSPATPGTSVAPTQLAAPQTPLAAPTPISPVLQVPGSRPASPEIVIPSVSEEGSVLSEDGEDGEGMTENQESWAPPRRPTQRSRPSSEPLIVVPSVTPGKVASRTLCPGLHLCLISQCVV